MLLLHVAVLQCCETALCEKKEEVDFSIEFCHRKKFKYNMHACNTHAKVDFFIEKLTKGHANDSILTL